MTQQETEQLQKQLAAGSEYAFAVLYDRWGARMYRVAVRITSSRHDAEDVVQEVFANLASNSARLANVKDLAAYLFTSIRNCSIRFAQRQKKQNLAGREIDVGQLPDTSDCDERLVDPEELQIALAKLPLEQREVVTLKVDAELTFKQIAQVLNISTNTVASRYRYALEKLRQTARSKA